MTRERGTVKWFDDDKGYGFIEPDEGGEDVFVHHSDIEGDDDFATLGEGERVSFEALEGDKGLKAVEVRELAGESVSGGRASRSLGEVADEEADELEPDDMSPEERGAREAGEEIVPLDERFGR